MRATASFSVAASPDRVVAWLANPRNLLIANHDGPMVEQSDPPVGVGSWAVLAFDQIQVRIEYTAFDPPDLVAASIVSSGRGSGGMNGAVVYRLGPVPGSGGTRVSIEAEQPGGPFAAMLGRLMWPIVWRRLRTRVNALPDS